MFRRGAIAKPMRQRNAAGVLRGQACHIEHHGTETAALQQQVGHFQRLFNTRPRRKLRSRSSVLCRSYRIAERSRHATNGIVTQFLRSEEAYEGTSYALRFLAGMRTATSTMQTLIGSGRTRQLCGNLNRAGVVWTLSRKMPQRTCSKYGNAMPAAAAHSGLSMSPTSTQAHTFPAAVSCAIEREPETFARNFPARRSLSEHRPAGRPPATHPPHQSRWSRRTGDTRTRRQSRWHLVR